MNEALLTRSYLVRDGTGTGIHHAVVRATSRAVVLGSLAHLVSKYEVVYASDCSARMSDDRIQLFLARTAPKSFLPLLLADIAIGLDDAFTVSNL